MIISLSALALASQLIVTVADHVPNFDIRIGMQSRDRLCIRPNMQV